MAKKYYPVNIDLEGKKCLVVGGGAVGERKVRSLLECGASVTLVSKTLTAGLEALAAEGRVRAFRRPFAAGDEDGAFLVFCATDDAELNRAVFEAAEKKGALVNVVDRPALCNFIVPAVVRKGSLLASVSTSAAAPAMAKKLKSDLERAFADGYAPLLEFLAEKRAAVRELCSDIAIRRAIFDGLLESGLIKLFTGGSCAFQPSPAGPDFDYAACRASNPSLFAEAELIFEEVCARHIPGFKEKNRRSR